MQAATSYDIRNGLIEISADFDLIMFPRRKPLTKKKFSTFSKDVPLIYI